MAEKGDSNDWRSKCGNVLERWVKARDMDFFTDVTFMVGSTDSAKSFSAHRIVLAFNSPVFEDMFFGTSDEPKMPIVLTDVDPEAFHILIKFMYGETISFSGILEACKTFLVANTYLVKDLRKSVEDYLSQSKLDDAIFWEIINQEELFLVVREKCLDHIASNAAILFKSYLLLSLSSDIMEAILYLSEMNISEFELLSALVRWNIGNLEPEESLKTELESYLCYIRFSCLTLDEFCDFLDCHPGLLDAEDALQIMKHLLKREVYRLPHWCSPNQEKRSSKYTEK